jgi:hypothetical protein
MHMGAGGGLAALTLAELVLFWAATVVHVLRLLSTTGLPDADRAADAGHAVMGAGMTVMVFPGVPAGALRVLALVYAALAVLFLARAACRRSPAQHWGQDTAIGTGQAVMAYMFAAPTDPPMWLPVGIAAVLALCAMVHGRRLLDAPHQCDGGLFANRMLVTVPHVGAVMMTLAMAGMVGAS